MEHNESPTNGDDVAAIQKEAMSTENELSMEDLLKLEDLNLDFPKQGEVRTGTIASISNNEILVSIGAKSEGIIPSRELDQLSDEERRMSLEFINRRGPRDRRSSFRGGDGSPGMRPGAGPGGQGRPPFPSHRGPGQ